MLKCIICVQYECGGMSALVCVCVYIRIRAYMCTPINIFMCVICPSVVVCAIYVYFCTCAVLSILLVFFMFLHVCSQVHVRCRDTVYIHARLYLCYIYAFVSSCTSSCGVICASYTRVCTCVRTDTTQEKRQTNVIRIQRQGQRAHTALNRQEWRQCYKYIFPSLFLIHRSSWGSFPPQAWLWLGGTSGREDGTDLVNERVMMEGREEQILRGID